MSGYWSDTWYRTRYSATARRGWSDSLRHRYVKLNEGVKVTIDPRDMVMRVYLTPGDGGEDELYPG